MNTSRKGLVNDVSELILRVQRFLRAGWLSGPKYLGDFGESQAAECFKDSE
jgi:hypothetical protein